MKARAFIAAVILAAAGLPAGAATAQSTASGHSSLKERLIGAWHMVSIDEPGPEGKVVHHTDRQGMLVFTSDNHTAVQVMYPASEVPSFISTAYAEKGYEAVYGTYVVDEQTRTVTSHVQGALVRGLIGKDLPRLMVFSPDGHLTVRSVHQDEHWAVTWEHD
jgi:Lipocalin-like domain